MTLDFNTSLESMITQFPLAAAAVYVARLYMRMHEQATHKLISTFEDEVKACENRFNIVLRELLSLKAKINRSHSNGKQRQPHVHRQRAFHAPKTGKSL